MLKLTLVTAFLTCGSMWVGAQPIVISQPTNQVVLSGSNVTFSIVVSGAGPFTYQWQFNGTNLPNNILTTVAGGGSTLGNNGPATNASLYYPQGIGFDTNGNLFITDNNDNIVRKVDTNGIITTIAGKYSLTGAFGGDGAAATNASLNHPNNVAISSSGSIYIADIFNQRIRRVNSSGIISTVAGNGTLGSIGDGGLATSANLNYPACVAIDGTGNYYIADLINSRVRKVAAGYISTIAGKSAQGFSGDGGPATSASLMNPQGINFDSAGNLYIADTSNNRIRKVDGDGVITTVAGSSTTNFTGDGGMAINAGLSRPWSVCADNSGNLYIADYGHNRIRKVDTNGLISTVAGKGNTGGFGGDGGPATKASLNGPACVALDARGNLYIADWYNNRIREIHFSGLPELTLSNVSVANFGNYSVIVSSPSGSVTNNFTLNVPVTPNFSGLTIVSRQRQLTWNSQSNLSYQLQFTTNLAFPVWFNSGGRISATSNSLSVTDDPGSDAQRFYRVKWEQ
jgi:sugar lactone lactonase YvrE